MASNDAEVLDPVVPVENSEKSNPGSELNRRYFIAALGAAGAAAAGAALVTTPKALAQQPSNPNGYSQIDVLNLLLNIKYLKATLYSYITQGADLPASSYVTVGTGEVYNAPAKITFSNQQITDLFNEMYYDELNQLIALRAAQGIGVAPRPVINLLGTGPSGSAPSSTTTTLTQSQAIALARLLEDLSVTAFAFAASYFTGTNLALAVQALASDGYHSGAIRLLAIQNAVQYQGTQYASYASSNTSQTAVTFSGATTTGSSVIYTALPASAGGGANLPQVGNIVTGVGIPPGAGAIIKSVINTASATPTAVITKGSNILQNVSSVSNLAVGQPITGTNIPAGAYITALGSNTITFSPTSGATGSTSVSPTGYSTAGSATITGVSSTSGLIVGQTITGTGIPSGTTISAFSGSAGSATITLSQAATVTSQIAPTGTFTAGSPTITSVSSLSGLAVGSALSGAGIPAGTVVNALPSSNSITMSNNATVSATETFNSPTTVTLTSPTAVAVSVGLGQVVITGAATVTGVNTFYIVIPDNQDVEPADLGSASAEATGPAAIAGTSPTVYQGFFNTAGSGSSSPTGTPAGLAFTRTFQQVLSVLYGYNSTNSLIATQNYEGGFFPEGAAGNINSTI